MRFHVGEGVGQVKRNVEARLPNLGRMVSNLGEATKILEKRCRIGARLSNFGKTVSN